MLLEGTVKDGKVVLDNTTCLSEGTRVKISSMPLPEQPPQIREFVRTLLQNDESAERTGKKGAGHVS
jgi:hypothetical protein